MPLTIPTESKFGFDLSEFAADRPSVSERVNALQLPQDVQSKEALGEAITTSQSFARGEIPEDLRAQVEQSSAERSLQSGIGLGQAGRNLTARDIGRTSVDLAQQGIENIAALSAQQFQFDSLKEEMRQADDKFAAVMRESDINTERVQLAAAEVVSNNQRFMQGLINNLIIINIMFF